ncbi:hypothetical protein RA25_21600 [Leisingera sp. ANG-S5]|nr:hypothetical protein RA25_21600 [Leisingera sp. ANG-S5]
MRRVQSSKQAAQGTDIRWDVARRPVQEVRNTADGGEARLMAAVVSGWVFQQAMEDVGERLETWVIGLHGYLLICEL